MKKLSIFLGLLFAIIICGGIIAYKFLTSDSINDRISNLTQKTTGSAAVFGSRPQFSLFPPTLKLGPIQWHGKVGHADLDISSRSISIELAVTPLLAGHFEPATILIDQPEVICQLQTSREAATKKNDSGAVQTIPELPRLIIQHGIFKYADATENISLASVNLTAENIGSRQEADIKLDFMVSAKTGWGESIDGNLAFRSKMRYYAPNVTFRHAAATFTATSGSLTAVSPLHLNGDGAFNLSDNNFKMNDLVLQMPATQIHFTGAGQVVPPNLKGKLSGEMDVAQMLANISPEVTAVLAADVSWLDNVIKFDDLAIKMADCAGSGNLHVRLPENGQKQPGMYGNISLGKLVLDKIFSSAPVQPGKKPSIHSIFLRPDLDLKVVVEQFRYKKLDFQNLSCAIAGESGNYKLKSLDFSWADGTVKTNGDITPNGTEMKIQGRNIVLGKALDQMNISGWQGGVTSLDATLTTGKAGIGSLSGAGTIDSKNLKLDILAHLADYLPFVSPERLKFAEGENKLHAELSAKNGIIHIAPLRILGEGLDAEGSGQVNLKTNTVDSSINIGILGLHLPLLIQGELTHPSIKVGSGFLRSLEKDLP